MPAILQIELKGLRFFANHGWQEEEAFLDTEFEVSLVATIPAKDHIHSFYDTIDYTELYALLKNVFMEREQLLETVAQKITDAIEAQFADIQRLHLTITKLAPVIPAFTGTVGITFIKEFRK